MAARALVPFVLVTQVPSTVHTLLQELPPEPGPTIQHNHIHGTLLQVCTHAHISVDQRTHIYITYAITLDDGYDHNSLEWPQVFIWWWEPQVESYPDCSCCTTVCCTKKKHTHTTNISCGSSMHDVQHWSDINPLDRECQNYSFMKHVVDAVKPSRENAKSSVMLEFLFGACETSWTQNWLLPLGNTRIKNKKQQCFCLFLSPPSSVCWIRPLADHSTAPNKCPIFTKLVLTSAEIISQLI